MDLRTDQMLAAAFAGGDIAAYGVLYDRHAPGVYSAACALIGPGDAAGSAVAAVFQRLARDIKRRRRVADAPIVRLDTLTRQEVRRRMRVRRIRLMRRGTDGLDRTLPSHLRASVLGLANPPRWRPTYSALSRIALGVAAIGAAIAVVSGGAWLGREILDNVEASDATFAPTNPTLVAPILTSPPTSEAAVLPPVPPAAAPPIDPNAVAVDPAAAAVGPVQLSALAIEFGPNLTDGSVVLRNNGPDPQLWNVEGSPAPFAMSASPGLIEPGQEAVIAFSLDRSLLPEGNHEVSVVISGAVPQTLTLRAQASSAPKVTLTRSTPQFLLACEGGSIEVAASIFDDSPIASTMVSWIGPGAPGAAPMAPGISEWVGTITPEPIVGSWTYAIQTADVLGNKSALTGAFEVNPC